MYRGYRCSSVPPGLYRSGSALSSPIVAATITSPGRRLPSYCPSHGQYYGYSGYTRPAATSASKTHSSLTSRSSFEPRSSCKTMASAGYYGPAYTTPYPVVRFTGYNDPVYSTHRFGTRLGGGYAATLARPEIYEQTYGVSYLPCFGRDSFSAYKIADATIDDGGDLVNASCKRDNQVLRNVERYIADMKNCPPPTRKSFVRASSVPPRSAAMTSKFSRRPAGATVTVRGENDVCYRTPPPRIQYHYETVNKGSDLLSARERMCAREFVDLTSPSGTLSLKMRIHDAQNALDKQGAMLSKYSVGPDADDIEVNSELRRIKTSRALRAKSVV